MFTLIGYETKRSHDFDIKTTAYGPVRLMSDTKMLIIFGQSLNPKIDFKFTFPFFIDNVEKGTFKFELSMIEKNKYEKLTLTAQNKLADDKEVYSMSFKIAISEPLEKEIEGDHIDVHLPEHFAIGHRGSGSNLVTREFMENSLPGFQKAYERGADVVEFDVQLTKDKVPIIYHDFHIDRDQKYEGVEPLKQKKNGKYKYAWKQLTLQQHHDSGFDTEWKIPRPTFKDLMTKLPKDLVFDIEIKYPFQMRFEDKIPYTERNEFLRVILDDMQQNMGDRQVFFSAFDPIVCTMLATKQHKWDVYQLMTVEKEDTIEKFALKIRSFLPLHKELGIKGFVLEADNMLSADIAKDVLSMGFTIATYGKANNIPQSIVTQLDLGIRGICTDMMDQLRSVIDDYDNKGK